MVTTTSDFADGNYCNASNQELVDLINEARNVTGKNWQLHETKILSKRWLRKPEIKLRYSLCVEIGGFPSLQKITAATTAGEVRCYLYGILSNVTSDPLGKWTLTELTGVVQVGSTRWFARFCSGYFSLRASLSMASEIFSCARIARQAQIIQNKVMNEPHRIIRIANPFVAPLMLTVGGIILSPLFWRER